MTSELQHYRLDRTGRPPLAFEGEFLARADGEEYLDQRGRNPRWHDISLYRTGAGRYVLHVRYFAEWKDEVGYDEALVLDGPGGVVAALRDLDPVAHVAGYPPGEQFQKKQARLLHDVKVRFDRCVSDLFAQLGPEFAERVE